MNILNCECFGPLNVTRKQFFFMLSETNLVFMLFETNLVFMLFGLMLFGNSPLRTAVMIGDGL